MYVCTIDTGQQNDQTVTVERGSRPSVASGPTGDDARGPTGLECNVRPLSTKHSGHSTAQFPVDDDVTVLMTSHPSSSAIISVPLDRGGVGEPSAAARRGRQTSHSSTNDRYNWQLCTSAGDCNRKWRSRSRDPQSASLPSDAESHVKTTWFRVWTAERGRILSLQQHNATLHQ